MTIIEYLLIWYIPGFIASAFLVWGIVWMDEYFDNDNRSFFTTTPVMVIITLLLANLGLGMVALMVLVGIIFGIAGLLIKWKFLTTPLW